MMDAVFVLAGRKARRRPPNGWSCWFGSWSRSCSTLDQAAPVGLIVNELITNAAKYAFGPGDHGRIVVRLKKRDDRATVTISDNGHGKPKASQPGVGTKLVRSLASQIGARLRVVSGPGLTYSLTFPVKRGEAEAPW